MTLNFQLSNKEFEDTLAVSVNGETKDLTTQDNQIAFDVPDIEKAVVQIEYKRKNIKQIKNPVGKFFAYLFFFLLSSIIFFDDNDNGIGIHKYFYNAKPFDLKKAFKIIPTENVVIKFIPPKYDEATRHFLPPDIEVVDTKTTDEELFFEYNQVSFKKEFQLYHYPAYTVLFSVVLALNVLTTTCLINQFVSFNLMGVIGVSLCCLVVLILLIAFIILFVFTHRLFRQIDNDLENQKY